MHICVSVCVHICVSVLSSQKSVLTLLELESHTGSYELSDTVLKTGLWSSQQMLSTIEPIHERTLCLFIKLPLNIYQKSIDQVCIDLFLDSTLWFIN